MRGVDGPETINQNTLTVPERERLVNQLRTK
jgi:hypothetical protein